MKNLIFDQVGSPAWRSLLRLTFLTLILQVFARDFKAQCYCGGAEINPPQQDYFRTYDPVYNEYGEMVSYNFHFQFKCLGLPMDLFDMYDEYYYQVLYRIEGSNDPWQISETSVWNDIGDFMVSVYGLTPGVKYEFRVNCPCPYPGCDAATQVANFLNGEPLNNVTSPWTDLYCPGSWFKYMDVFYYNTENNSVHIAWLYNILPPGPAKIEYRLKTTPASAWIQLPDAPYPDYILTNLSPCTEYEFKVTLPIDCPTNSKTLTFTTSDCSANLTNVTEITGTSAKVFYGPNSYWVPDSYTIKWWISPSQTNSATTTNLNYVITGLSPNTTYFVKVEPNCGASAQCPSNTQTWQFKTNCDPFEYNDSFSQATPINLDQDYAASIHTETDIDYFTFTANCERVQIYVDHPLVKLYSDPFSEYLADMNVKVFDENLAEIPLLGFCDPPISCDVTRPYYALNPGHQYFVVISKPSNILNWDLDYQKSCYRFKVERCNKCYDNAYNVIWGYSQINSLPATEEYGLYDFPFVYSNIQWNVTGPATIIPTPDPNVVNLHFEVPGTVVLSASVTRCDGAQMTYYKTIQVSDPCFVSGVINLISNIGEPQPLLSYNPMYATQYVVTLNLPIGTPYSWTKISGQAVWAVDGNTIKIKQSSADVVFQLKLLNGDCAEKPRKYTFSLVGFQSGDVGEFRVSPNPVNEILWVDAPLRNVADEAEFEMELFNSYSTRVANGKGNLSEKSALDCSNLPSGNYLLKISYNNTIRVFKITKI